MIKDLISVLMCSYNSEKTIEKSIQSIVNQDYKNIEFLILDDNSTDSTLEIIEKYAIIDKRIRIVKNHKNIGLTKSLNKLLRIANGQFMARQDSDDISLKNRLSTQIDYIKETNSKAVTSRAVIKGTKMKIPKYSHLFPNKLVMKYKNPFIHGTLMMDMNIINEIGGYDENFYFAQDYKLYVDCYRLGVNIEIINSVLYELNNENNISNLNKESQAYYFNCAKKNKIPNKLRNSI